MSRGNVIRNGCCLIELAPSAVDVHMSDLLAGRQSLQDFSGMVACGGFSYGDVLGAGEGWAKTILFNHQLRDQFEQFFHRPETFSFEVCNGCQMLKHKAIYRALSFGAICAQSIRAV